MDKFRQREDTDSFDFSRDEQKRKERRAKKSKTRSIRFRSTEEEGSAPRKKKLREYGDHDSLLDDWDEDDQILYQWRRKGEVDSTSSDYWDEGEEMVLDEDV